MEEFDSDNLAFGEISYDHSWLWSDRDRCSTLKEHECHCAYSAV